MRRLAVGSLAFALTAAIAGAAFAQAPAALPPTSPGVGAPGAPFATAGAPSAYDRKGRRDPFEPTAPAFADGASLTVTSARLKGIVRGRTPRALLETSDGLGYILKVGDAFADGRLTEIGADSVVFSVRPRPGSTTDRVILRLPDD